MHNAATIEVYRDLRKRSSTWLVPENACWTWGVRLAL
jgi:hypothetical protein